MTGIVIAVSVLVAADLALTLACCGHDRPCHYKIVFRERGSE